MSDQSSGFSWFAVAKWGGIVFATWLGTATGAFVSMEQAHKEDLLFRAEVRARFENIEKHLGVKPPKE